MPTEIQSAIQEPESTNLRNEFIFICEYALFDKQNKLSMMGEFTSVQMAGFPAELSVLYIVTRWTAGGEHREFNESIIIVSEEGVTVADSKPQQVKLTTRRFTGIRRFDGLKFERPGKYYVVALADGEIGRIDHFYVRERES